MAYGVQSTGFVDKPIEDILSEIEASEKADAAFGAGFDVSAQSPTGQINGIMAAKIRELWEVAQDVYNSFDPDSATGLALSSVSSLSGTVKAAATKSTVTAAVNLDAGKTLAAGAVASVSGNATARFVTLADATNPGGAPAPINVEMEAETAGIVTASAATLTVIETAQTGWNTVTNALDAVLGEELETDAVLRLRRETEIRRAGAGHVDAIRSDILAVTAVDSVTMLENDSDVTDDNGLPPHSFEALVLNGAANDIAQAIWDSKPAGIQAYGGTSGTAVDDDANNQTVPFSLPDEVRIYIDLTVTTDAALFPPTGNADIKAAIAAWALSDLSVGEDLVLSQLYPVIFGISGVLDITALEADIVTPPVGVVNLAITTRQLATIDTGDIRIPNP